MLYPRSTFSKGVRHSQFPLTLVRAWVGTPLLVGHAPLDNLPCNRRLEELVNTCRLGAQSIWVTEESKINRRRSHKQSHRGQSNSTVHPARLRANALLEPGPVSSFHRRTHGASAVCGERRYQVVCLEA